jgi:3-dehydroquinate synthase
MKYFLEAEGRTSLIETAANDLTGRLKELTGPRRGLFLLDHAFKGEAEKFASEFPRFQIAFTEERGEAAKTFAEARRIFEILARGKYSRDDFLIARGGGSLTDLGAFCAGLYKRGLKLILVPTTLLGAVDAAVGGKTAINFSGVKNQIGHFYLPSNVLADLESFKTLPRERLAEGLAEAYKTGLLFDAGRCPAPSDASHPSEASSSACATGQPGHNLVELVENETEALLGGDLTLLAEVAARSYTAKARLVARDFREEQGIRDVLNLGHTYGHVVESFYGNSALHSVANNHGPALSHGRAVAVGLAVAAELSRPKLGDAKADRVIRTARALGGPWPDLPPEETARALLMADKKIRGGALRFILLDDFEKPRLAEIEADEILKAARRLGDLS